MQRVLEFGFGVDEDKNLERSLFTDGYRLLPVRGEFVDWAEDIGQRFVGEREVDGERGETYWCGFFWGWGELDFFFGGVSVVFLEGVDLFCDFL